MPADPLETIGAQFGRHVRRDSDDGYARHRCPESRRNDIECVQRLPRERKQGLTSVGQRHPMVTAEEQFTAEFPLEAADSLAQRRRSHVQSLRGPTEVEFLRDRDEVAQVPNLHSATLQGS